MTGTSHVWRRGFGWAYCSRCGVVRHFNLETQCRGALPPIGTRAGELSPTSDEREIDRFRNEVSALTSLADAREAEVARLQRLVTAAADALDAVRSGAVARGFPVHPLVVYHLRKMARDLRVALDQGAQR